MDLIIISDGRTDETSLRIKKVEIMGNEQLQLVLKYIVYQENKIFNLFFFFFFKVNYILAIIKTSSEIIIMINHNDAI